MALILREISKLYHFLNDEICDKRTQGWFLMSNPFPGLALLGVYLYVVFKWGPRFMKSRKPYGLRKSIAIYNIIQIAACAYIVYQSLLLVWATHYAFFYQPLDPSDAPEAIEFAYKSLRLGWGTHYTFFCQPVDHSDAPEAIEFAFKVCYSYFVVKLIDLLDTVFFVLRKKQNQVTFLHVYHHFGMVMLSWSMVKWLPGGHCTLLVLVNSAVHMVMYFYYLLTVWDPIYKQSVWWKKHVTQIQLAQFTLLFLHFTTLLVKSDCDYPKLPALILIPQNLFMSVLFGDFYYKTYIRTPRNKAH